MPAAYYDFKATPEERSFGEQMVHIAASLFERFSQISGIAPVKSAVPKTITKEFPIEWLNQSFDYVIQVLPKLTEDQLSKTRFKVDFEGRPGPEINGRDMIMNIFVHVAHHRAQCEVYLLLKGITPPEYTFSDAYSSRSVRAGSMRIARSEGCQQARRATPPTIRKAATSVSGSCGLTP